MNTLEAAITLLQRDGEWTADAFMNGLKTARKEIGVPGKVFWTVLRHGIAGMKVRRIQYLSIFHAKRFTLV